MNELIILPDPGNGNSRNSGKDIPNEVIKTIYQRKGANMSATAAALNIARSTLVRMRCEDKDLDDMLKDVEESVIDIVESQLIALVGEKNPQAVIFYLKTKGKNRGYVEGRDIHTTVDLYPTMHSQQDAKEYIKNLFNTFGGDVNQGK